MSQDTFGLAVSDTRLSHDQYCSGALPAGLHFQVCTFEIKGA